MPVRLAGAPPQTGRWLEEKDRQARARGQKAAPRASTGQTASTTPPRMATIQS
jgi:hypothetical protein